AVDVGVDPGQVLAVEPVETLGPDLVDEDAEVVDGGGRHGDRHDHQVAVGVGDVADVADATPLGRAVPVGGVGGRGVGGEVGGQAGRPVGGARRADVEELDPVAVATGAVAGDTPLGRGHRALRSPRRRRRGRPVLPV